MTDNIVPFPKKEKETTVTFSFDVEGENGIIYNFTYGEDGKDFVAEQVSDGEIEGLCNQLIAIVREYPELKDTVQDTLEKMVSYITNKVNND
jgi:hypothetical protein